MYEWKHDAKQMNALAASFWQLIYFIECYIDRVYTKNCLFCIRYKLIQNVNRCGQWERNIIEDVDMNQNATAGAVTQIS